MTGWSKGTVVRRQVLLIRQLALRCGLETGCSLYEVVTACSFFEGPVVHPCHGSVYRWLPIDRLAYILDHESAICLPMASHYHVVVCAFWL